MEMGPRFRIFFVTLVVSIWLLIIDAINPLANLDSDNLDSMEWTYYCLVISGLLMGIFGGLCSILVLMWIIPRCAGLTLMIAIFIAAILRIVAVTVGFKNFSGGGGFNTTNEIVTAAAIFLLQIYIVFEGWYVARIARRENMANVNA